MDPQLPQHILERPIADALAVGEAAADKHPRLPSYELRKLVGQARLSDTGLAEHGDQKCARVFGRAGERLAENREFTIAANKGCVQLKLPCRSICVDLPQSPRTLSPPLEGIDDGHLRDQTASRRAENDFSLEGVFAELRGGANELACRGKT